MELREHRKVFVAASLILMLIAASPVLGMVVSIPTGRAFFSEFGILGPNHRAEGYPFTVGINTTQGPVYVAVRNRMGHSVYYRVYVKLRNETQPSASRTMPSPLEPIYEFRFLLSDREGWETPFVFSFRGEPSFINGISINGDDLPVSYFSSWNPERNGVYYQLFFELWLYNVTMRDFEYHNRYVRIWLNMTSSWLLNGS